MERPVKRSGDFCGRQASVLWGLEELGLLLCTHVWKVGRWALFGINGILVAKVVLSFLVVILNYVISKFLVFQTKEKK